MIILNIFYNNLTLNKDIEMNQIKRKAFSLIELIFVIVIIGGLAIAATKYAVSQSDKIEVSSTTSQINRDISIAMSDYKRNYYLSNKKYSNVDAIKIYMYLPNSTDYELDTANNRINHISLPGFYFSVAPDSFNGTDDLKYKVFFDGTEVLLAKGWTPDKSQQIESDIASYFQSAYAPNSIIGGASTSLGTPNSAVTPSNINEDLLITIGGCGK